MSTEEDLRGLLAEMFESAVARQTESLEHRVREAFRDLLKEHIGRESAAFRQLVDAQLEKDAAVILKIIGPLPKPKITRDTRARYKYLYADCYDNAVEDLLWEHARKQAQADAEAAVASVVAKAAMETKS